MSPHQHSNSHVLNTCQVSLCDMQYVSTKLLWTLTNSKITSEMGEMFSKMCLKSGAFSLPCTGEFWCSWLAFAKLNTWVLWLSKHLLCGISACFPVRWTYATSNTEGIFCITNCKCPYRMQYSPMRLNICLLCSLNSSYSPQRTLQRSQAACHVHLHSCHTHIHHTSLSWQESNKGSMVPIVLHVFIDYMENLKQVRKGSKICWKETMDLE